MNTKVSKRVERKPLWQRGPQALNKEKDPNFEYRYVNDIGARISNFQEAGYEFVVDDELKVGDGRVFDPSDNGSAKRVVSNDGTVSYLMRIKKEWHEADQKAKQERVAETEQAIKNEAQSSADYGKLKIS